MYNRKTGWRAALVAAVATAVVVSLNPPLALATTGAPTIIKYRPASDPHVEGCAYFDGNVQHDYLCMYASSDMPVDEHDAPNFNHYPMESTYVYYYDVAAGGNIADPDNWKDAAALDTPPAFTEKQLPQSAGLHHLWAPTAHYGPRSNETLLYVPDVWPSSVVSDPTASQDGRISYIAVASTYNDLTGGNNPPWGRFRYKKNITYRGRDTFQTYMSDPAVATLAGTHPITDDHPLADAATWLLWANGDNFGGGRYCGGISIGQLKDDDLTELTDDSPPFRQSSEIVVNGIGDALGVCSSDGVTLNHPYMEGPELYDLNQVNVPVPANPTTGKAEPFALFFAAKPADNGPHPGNQVLAWASASNVRGPYTYRGIIMDSSDSSWTNHGSITASTIANPVTGQSEPRFLLWFHDSDNDNRPHKRQARVACLQYSRSAASFLTVQRPATMPNINACVSMVS